MEFWDIKCRDMGTERLKCAAIIQTGSRLISYCKVGVYNAHSRQPLDALYSCSLQDRAKTIDFYGDSCHVVRLRRFLQISPAFAHKQ